MERKLLSLVKKLSEGIGPRRPTSKEEKKAAQLIKKELGKWSDTVFLLPFPSLSTFSWSTGLIYLLSSLGGFFSLYSLPLGFILSLLGLATFILEMNTFPVLTKHLSWRESQNVMGIIQPKKKIKKKVLIVAHYDSSRSSILFHPRLVGGFRKSFLLMCGAIILIPLLLLLRLFFPLFSLQYFTLLPSSYLLLSVLLLIHREIFCADTPGGNDNASGVAVLLGVGEKIAREKPEETVVYLVATGSEEAGTVGMIHLLHSRQEELEGAYVINLDNLGTGQLKYTTGEGMLKFYPSDSELIAFMEDLVTQEGVNLVPGKNTLMSTDAVPAMARGFRAISIRAEDEQGLLPNWHWQTDTWEKVQEENLQVSSEVVWSLVKKIDAKS